MIYFTTSDHKHVLILEPTNMVRLEEGKPCVSPDSLVILCYSPDIEWTTEQLKKIFDENDHKLYPERLEELLNEGLSRPRVERNEKQANENQVIPLGSP